MELLLCRIHVHRKTQGTLAIEGFEEYLDMRLEEILKRAVESKPTLVQRSGSEWSIGNVEEIDERTISFKMGCEKREERGQKDEKGDFIEVVDISAPHTNVLLNWDLEVCGIERKSELGEHRSFPNRLKNLLNASSVAKNAEVEFNVDFIPNPEEFIQWIKESHSITKYVFTFSRSNIRDIKEDIQKPLALVADYLDGRNNIVSVENEGGLNKGNILDTIKSLMATGQKIWAKCRQFPGAKAEKRNSSGSIAKVEVDTLESVESRQDAANRMMEEYRRIRYDEGEERRL